MPTGAKVHTASETANMLGGGAITLYIPLIVDGRQIALAQAKYTDRELYELQRKDSRGR